MSNKKAQTPLAHKAPWTKEEFDEAWEMLNIDVQPLLIVIARRPHGYPIEALQALFSYSKPQQVQGKLMEVNRLHKHYPHKPRLFDSVRNGRVFTMDRAVAALVRTQDSTWVPLMMPSKTPSQRAARAVDSNATSGNATQNSVVRVSVRKSDFRPPIPLEGENETLIEITLDL